MIKKRHNKRNRDLHHNIHTGAKLFECNQCPKRFLRSSALAQHRDKFHSTERKFQCQICKKKFLTSYELSSVKSSEQSFGTAIQVSILRPEIHHFRELQTTLERQQVPSDCVQSAHQSTRRSSDIIISYYKFDDYFKINYTEKNHKKTNGTSAFIIFLFTT